MQANNGSSNRKPAVPAWASPRNGGVQVTKGGPAGYYQTGPNETKTFTQGGNIVRMAPNSTTAPTQRPLNQFQSFINMMTGQGQNTGAGGESSVRGAVPNPYKGASPTPYTPRLGVNASMGRAPQYQPADSMGGRPALPAWANVFSSRQTANPTQQADVKKLQQGMWQYNLNKMLNRPNPYASDPAFYTGR